MSVFTHIALERGGEGYEMESKENYFKEKLTLILSCIAILFSILSIIEVKTDFFYKASVGANLVKAGVLIAQPATTESLPVDPGEGNVSIILDGANVVYFEYKVVVFYESKGTLYYFDVPYIFESGKMSILRPNNNQEKDVEKVDLKFSKFDSTTSFEDNITDNLAEISIIYRGYDDSVYNDAFNLVENSSDIGFDTIVASPEY